MKKFKVFFYDSDDHDAVLREAVVDAETPTLAVLDFLNRAQKSGIRVRMRGGAEEIKD